MRKLLLASAAMLGLAGVSTSAFAQTPAAIPAVDGFNEQGLRVDLHGEVLWLAGISSNSDMNTTSAKVADEAFGQYWRLNPHAEITLANGLNFGADAGIRTSNTGAGTSDYLRYNTAVGFVNFGKAGMVRFGVDDFSGDQLAGPFEFASFGAEGGWDGDTGFLRSSAFGAIWQDPAENLDVTHNKLTYMTSALFPSRDATGAAIKGTGLILGASFEPNQSGDTIDTGNSCSNAYATNSCTNLSSSATASELTKTHNAFDVTAKYAGQFGPVGFGVFGEYIRKATIGSMTGSSNPYKAVSAGTGAAFVTYGPFKVGGLVGGGDYNNGGPIATGQKKETTYMVGVQYSQGPWLAGAHYTNSTMAGAQTAANKSVVGGEHTWGFAAGANYTVAPGLTVWAEYLYGQLHERGVDLTGNSSVTGSAAPHQYMHTNTGDVGISVAW